MPTKTRQPEGKPLIPVPNDCPAPRPAGEKAPDEVAETPRGPQGAPGSFLVVPHDTVDLVIANGGTTSGWVHIGNPSEVGLTVPTITNATLVVQVAYASDGTGGSGLVDATGTALLSYAASTGAFSIGSTHMGAVLGYPYMRVVLGAAQGAERTLKLTRKAIATNR